MVKSADKNCLFIINLLYPDIISGNYGDPKESVYWGQYHPYLRSVDAYVCPNFWKIGDWSMGPFRSALAP